jgi:hypothetical protein
MTLWEYITINLSDLPFKTRPIDLLDDAGKGGWELITITSNNVAYLKRPVDQPVPTATARRNRAANTAKP